MKTKNITLFNNSSPPHHHRVFFYIKKFIFKKKTATLNCNIISQIIVLHFNDLFLFIYIGCCIQ